MSNSQFSQGSKAEDCTEWTGFKLGRYISRGATGLHSRALIFPCVYKDLAVVLKCNVKLFADDTSLFTVVKEPITAANDRIHDLELIRQWAYAWRMSFNPDPEKSC